MGARIYEEPAKVALRAACEIAIDQAGFILEDEPVRVALDAESGLRGALLGDLQSLDASGNRTFYFLRPSRDAAVPKWIANLARQSHAVGAGEVYVVVREYAPELPESCIEVGAGLLLLNDSGVFNVVVSYAETRPRSLDSVLESRINDARRDLERRVDLAKKDIDSRVAAASSIISKMEDDIGERYVDGFDAEYRALEEWSADVSRRLDALDSRSGLQQISAVQQLISSGLGR